MEPSYSFDPCSIDGSNEEEITLDNWKPTVKTDRLVMSEWRLNQNGTNHDLDPGIDELKKIQSYLRKKRSDSDIMKMFGVSSETLVAIKKGCYSPVDGISMDNLSKIQKEFAALEKKIERHKETLIFMGEIMFTDIEMLKDFNKKLGRRDKKESEDGEDSESCNEDN